VPTPCRNPKLHSCWQESLGDFEGPSGGFWKIFKNTKFHRINTASTFKSSYITRKTTTQFNSRSLAPLTWFPCLNLGISTPLLDEQWPPLPPLSTLAQGSLLPRAQNTPLFILTIGKSSYIIGKATTQLNSRSLTPLTWFPCLNLGISTPLLDQQWPPLPPLCTLAQGSLLPRAQNTPLFVLTIGSL